MHCSLDSSQGLHTQHFRHGGQLVRLCWSSGLDELEKLNREVVSCVLWFLVGQMSPPELLQFSRRSLISVQGKLGWVGQLLPRGPRGLPCMFIMVLAHAHGLPLCAGFEAWFTSAQTGPGFLDSCTFGLRGEP